MSRKTVRFETPNLAASSSAVTFLLPKSKNTVSKRRSVFSIVKQLRLGFFLRKGVQVAEYLFRGMQNGMFPAKGGKLFRKFLFPGTGKFISVSVSAGVPLFHAGEKLVKLAVKVFPVSVPQGKPHAKADNTLYPGLGAVVKDAGKVFPCVVDKG